MMLVPLGPTVLTMWTLGVEVERCRCRDWPSAPGTGKRKAEVGDRRLSLCAEENLLKGGSQWRKQTVRVERGKTYPVGSGVKAISLCDMELSGNSIDIRGQSSV